MLEKFNYYMAIFGHKESFRVIERVISKYSGWLEEEREGGRPLYRNFSQLKADQINKNFFHPRQ